MNQNPAEQRQYIYLPRPHRRISERQANYCCPFCSKAYRTSTWLENHIKTKHITAMTQEQSGILVHMNNSYQTSGNNAMLLSPPSQESRRPDLAQDLPATVALLKQLLPLVEGLLPILEQMDGVSLCTPSMARSNLRTAKRCASSPDVRGEQGAKRRELDSVISEECTASNQDEPYRHTGRATSHAHTSMNSGDPYTQHTRSMTALPEGSHFERRSPHYSRRALQHPYFEQAQGSEDVLSYSSAPYFQAPNHGVPQRRHRLRPSQTPGRRSQPDSTTPVPYEFLGRRPPPSFSRERIPHQHKYSSDWMNSAEPPLGAMQPEPNIHRPYSMEDPHHQVGQHQSILQDLQQYPPSTHQETTKHILDDCHDDVDVFQDWNLSATLDPASTTSAAQFVETMTVEEYHDHSGQSISRKVPTSSNPGNC